jgi:hypothetical protein
MAVMSRIWLVFLLPLAAQAGTSADYSIDTSVLDNGGGVAASAAYTINPTIGPGVASASVNYVMRGGYAGQLFELVGIVIDKPSSPITLNERATRQLAVTATYNDATKSALPGNQVAWSVESGPIADIDSAGLATIGSVYENAAAVARAANGSLSDTINFSIVNTGLDDFPPYAADGLPDVWQLSNLDGVDVTQVSAASDADGDGLTNLQEYAFGTDPSSGSGAAVQWSGSTFQAAGLPLPYATTVGSSFSYRAVYSRRKDYNTVGLSYAVEFSADLVTWKASTTTPTRLADNGEIEAVYVPYMIFVNGRKATYFRVKVVSQ